MVFFNILLLKFGMVDWIFDKTRICKIHKIELYSLWTLWSVNFIKWINIPNRIIHAHILILFRSNIIRILEKSQIFCLISTFSSLGGHNFIPICTEWQLLDKMQQSERRSMPQIQRFCNSEKTFMCCGLVGEQRRVRPPEFMCRWRKIEVSQCWESILLVPRRKTASHPGRVKQSLSWSIEDQ
jgi:hypothetical protein